MPLQACTDAVELTALERLLGLALGAQAIDTSVAGAAGEVRAFL